MQFGNFQVSKSCKSQPTQRLQILNNQTID
jgi:hypothetical protein